MCGVSRCCLACKAMQAVPGDVHHPSDLSLLSVCSGPQAQGRWREVVSSPTLLSPAFNIKPLGVKHNLISVLKPHTGEDYPKGGWQSCSDASGYKDINSKQG